MEPTPPATPIEPTPIIEAEVSATVIDEPEVPEPPKLDTDATIDATPIVEAATTTLAPAPQPAPQDFVPPAPTDPSAPPQQGAPYGQPGQPGQPGQGYPQTPQYPGASYPPPAAPPQKKKTWVVVVVIVAVLLCCVAPIITGVVLYNIGQDALNRAQDLSDVFDNNKGNNNTYTDPSDEPDKDKAPTLYDEVLLDDSIAKITLDTSIKYEGFGWYEIECTVENKSDKTLYFYFENATLNGEDISDFVVLYPTLSDGDFPAKKTTQGTLLFLETPSTLDLSSFKGTLVVVDTSGYSTVEEIDFDMSDM